MKISDVRVKLVQRSSERLQAFCSITLDGDFVIRDLKIIDGANGTFVAMPSRKLADRCPKCGCKNHLRAKCCNECGAQLKENRAPKDAQGRAKLHADIAHPINTACREQIQNAVIEAFQEEMERAKSPDYKPQDMEEFDNEDLTVEDSASEDDRESVSPQKESDTFEDYNSLIADLKREAAGRRKQHTPREPARYEEPPAEPEIQEAPQASEAPVPATREPAQEATQEVAQEVTQETAKEAAKENDDFGAGLL